MNERDLFNQEDYDILYKRQKRIELVDHVQIVLLKWRSLVLSMIFSGLLTWYFVCNIYECDGIIGFLERLVCILNSLDLNSVLLIGWVVLIFGLLGACYIFKKKRDDD